MDQNIVAGQEVTGLKDKEVSLEETAQSWPLRRVGLRVHDLAACVNYYTQLGFAIVRDERDEQGGECGVSFEHDGCYGRSTTA